MQVCTVNGVVAHLIARCRIGGGTADLRAIIHVLKLLRRARLCRTVCLNGSLRRVVMDYNHSSPDEIASVVIGGSIVIRRLSIRIVDVDALIRIGDLEQGQCRTIVVDGRRINGGGGFQQGIVQVLLRIERCELIRPGHIPSASIQRAAGHYGPSSHRIRRIVKNVPSRFKGRIGGHTYDIRACRQIPNGGQFAAAAVVQRPGPDRNDTSGHVYRRLGRNVRPVTGVSRLDRISVK